MTIDHSSDMSSEPIKKRGSVIGRLKSKFGFRKSSTKMTESTREQLEAPALLEQEMDKILDSKQPAASVNLNNAERESEATINSTRNEDGDADIVTPFTMTDEGPTSDKPSTNVPEKKSADLLDSITAPLHPETDHEEEEEEEAEVVVEAKSGPSEEKEEIVEAPDMKVPEQKKAINQLQPLSKIPNEMKTKSPYYKAEANEDIEIEATPATEPEDEGTEFEAQALITEVFGERINRLLYADIWGSRQDGFDAIQKCLKQMHSGSTEPTPMMLCGSIAAVNGGIEDKVVPVIYSALDCLRSIIKAFQPFVESSYLDCKQLTNQLSILTLSLISKIGVSNKRTRKDALKSLLRLRRLKKLRPLKIISLQLGHEDIPLKVRLPVVYSFASEFGLNRPDSLSVRDTMKVAMPALAIADDKMRAMAMDVVVIAYTVEGDDIMARLTGLKPAMVKILQRKFKEQKVAAEKEKEREQEEKAKAQSDAEEEMDGFGEEDATTDFSIYNEEDENLKCLVREAEIDAEEMFGPVLCRKLQSKTWSDRREALKEIAGVLRDQRKAMKSEAPNTGGIHQRHFAAHCVVITRSLDDSVNPVVQDATVCFMELISAYGDHVDFREENVRCMLIRCIIRFMKKLSKSSKKIQTEACKCLLRIARLKSTHGLSYILQCLFSPETTPGVQMHLLRILIPEYGFSQTNGLSVKRVMAATLQALAANDGQTRKSGIDVAVAAQRLVGADCVLKHLKSIKPAQLKELEGHFVENEAADDSRPNTVSQTELPPLRFEGNARRTLSSAPVGSSALGNYEPVAATPSPALEKPTVMSAEEEELMSSILDM